jgi:hypothetical protein
MTTSANHNAMLSGVHYVGLAQPLTTSFTRLISGGTLSLVSSPT